MPVRFDEDEKHQVERFLEGMKLALAGKADVWFVPPLPGDDGVMFGGGTQMQRDMGEYKRSYLLIKGDAPAIYTGCAPAVVFAEDEGELVDEFLERMSGVFERRFYIVPQKVFLRQTRQNGGRLDEFDEVMYAEDGHRRRRVRIPEARSVVVNSMEVPTFLEMIEETDILEDKRNLEELWKDLDTIWGEATLLDSLKNGLGALKEWMAETNTGDLGKNWLPQNMDAVAAEVYVQRLIDQGYVIEGINCPWSGENRARLEAGKRPVILQANGPSGVVMLPLAVCLEAEKRAGSGIIKAAPRD